MSAFIGNVDDIVSKYIDLVPIGLRYSDSYLVYFALLCRDNSIDLDSEDITEVNDLADIEKTSYKFVDGLWQYLNTHKDDKKRALDFYEIMLDNLIDYGTDMGYLSMYTYLVPTGLEDSKEYKAYLVHLVEFYKKDVDNADTPEDLEDSSLVSYGTLENIWSYYNYNFRQGNPDDKLALSTVVKAIRDIWADKCYEYLYLVPEYLRTNEGFLVFLSLMVHEFEIAQKNIEDFPNLVDSDKVPIKFLENLGAYVNFRYLERGDEDFNREALLSMRSIWEMRGSDHAIIMAATHGYNPGYVGGDLFIPNYPITNELAELIVGITRVFIHSRSKFSCIHVYPDGISYCHGVIILIVPFINDNIRRKITEVIPAGVRYVFWLFIAAQSDNPEETGKYGEMLYHIQIATLPSKGEPKYVYNPITGEDISIPINLFMTIAPTVVYENYYDIDMFTHSVSPFPSYDADGNCYVRHLLSGQRLFNIFDTYKTNDLIACALNLDLLKIPFMGSSYTGSYKISPSGEYIDTITTSGRPGTSAIRRKFDYYPEDDNLLLLCSYAPVDADDKSSSGIWDIDVAVSALPISIQSEFYSFKIIKTNHLSILDDDVVVKDPLELPVDLLEDDGSVEGTIAADVKMLYLFSDGSFDINHYMVSPTGEYIDTVDKSVDTVIRTINIDYRPEVELELIPA